MSSRSTSRIHTCINIPHDGSQRLPLPFLLLSHQPSMIS
jgi:hypothetical protein